MNADKLIEHDDALLDILGGRDRQLAGEQADTLCPLLLALRDDADRLPAPELVSTDVAVRAIAVARNRRFRRIHLTAAGVAGAAGVPLTVLLDGTPLEIALAFPVGAISYLLGYWLLERTCGGTR